MTLSTPKRSLLLSALGLAASVMALSPVAAASGATVSARLAAPIAGQKQAILDGILWKCTEDRCIAADNGSRAVVACQLVARKFGEVAEFSNRTGVLGADDLARCNNR